MMQVQNRKCIRRLSYKTLWASRKRNLIAIFAIALTTLLFTSLFTIVMSLNSSYETHVFRQIGGYSHGTFKEVDNEQIEKISAHPRIKKSGRRLVIGFCDTDAFGKVPAEISYMDHNTTKWSYSIPEAGREPEKENEIAMDTKALQLLGIKPELGAEVTLSFTVGNKKERSIILRTDTFVLTGFWEYDETMPVHYINVSEAYANQVEAEAVADGMEPFRTDLNVMLASSINIRGRMEQVDTDLGYQWENTAEENCVRIGVNWGYTSSQLSDGFDMGMAMAIAAFLVLVIFTGYLIIYNIFQISVSGDIRFYGLLKTIGVTPGQLQRIIRQQALLLCVIGLPVGLLCGYAAGMVLTPFVLERSTIGTVSTTISNSPLIFAGAAAFSLATVLISCARPGRMAARVSPVEATKYIEVVQIKKKKRVTRGAKVFYMAFANLGRNKRKTALVVLSLSLSVVLLTIMYSFVSGFDMDKYLEKQTCADFIVGTTKYFRFSAHSSDAELGEMLIEEIQQQTTQSLNGAGYSINGMRPVCRISSEKWRNIAAFNLSEESINQMINENADKDGSIEVSLLLEGLDDSLFEKLTVVEGDLAPLFNPELNAIAIIVSLDDYGNIYNETTLPKIGEKLPVTYREEFHYIDSRTGKKIDEDTPEEFIESCITKSHEIEYTVCALVILPYSMSHRYGIGLGYEAVLPVNRLRKDSNAEIYTMFYLFDTPDIDTESMAEAYLAELTVGDFSDVMYQSKETTREEFKSFQNMFLLLGGLLCCIIGFVGILNFFNAIMTGIFSRRREFAILQSIGMTNRQLKRMLIYEGLFYALGSVVISLLLILAMGPLVGKLLESMFWFFHYKFTILPILMVAPVFALLGCLIPLILYQHGAGTSVVERLREAE